MEQRPQYFIVGVFVLVLAILGIVFVLWFSKVGLSVNTNLYEIFFSGSVTGLRENEEVKFRGIPIGKVVKISVSKVDPDKVRVLVSIDKPELIRNDSVAKIEAQGLTGYTFVQIKGSTRESPILKRLPGRKYPIIQSQPSEIEALFNEIPIILKNIEEVAKKLSATLDSRTIHNFQQTVDHIAQITQELSQGPDSLSNVIKDFKEDFKKVVKAAEDFSKTLEQLDQVVAENRTSIHDFSTEGLPEFTRLMRKAQDAMESVRKVADRLEKGPAEFFGGSKKEGYKVE